jgi:hypothetical protein
MDIIIREGMDNIFSACFYDITTTDAIKLARTTLRNLHIDQESRDLIKRIIDGKEEEYNAHLSTLPPSPDKLAIDAAAAAEVVVEATIPATEESVGFWSRTVNSVSGFVGTAKDTVVSAASKGKSAVNEFGTATVSKVHDLGVAIKVAATAFDRGSCMKTEFREIYDDNRRKYEDFMAVVRKQSNRVTTAISYSRTEAFTGWALVGFSLYMLSYLRRRIKDQNIEERLGAVENRREEEQLAIGNEQLAIGNEQGQGQGEGQLVIGNVGQEPAAQGQLMANPWNNPNLPVRRVGVSPARQRQLQLENANEEKEEGGGRRQTKKRRRQTKKPRRITRKRRRR